MLLHVQQHLPFERLVIADTLGTEAGHTRDPIGRHPAAQRMSTHTRTLRYRRNPGMALTILLSRRQFDRFTALRHETTPNLISKLWGSLHEGVRHAAEVRHLHAPASADGARPRWAFSALHRGCRPASRR